ncbi:hypothetical protein [Pseudarthrobacter sp. GA104]|uniref:hypothetical protein n=1 Tax=Pseudarthrobacter sp. GA104 TaxID=2676311 RepID=UPI0012F8B2FB|nr:hypothetical protein [Pseudarthrobacter sp. GA104]MUU69688.1 hypothetical protein [Pseudarthrobacter sp. GA104]
MTYKEPVVFFDPFAAEHLTTHPSSCPEPSNQGRPESSPARQPAQSRREREVQQLIHDLALLAARRKAPATEAEAQGLTRRRVDVTSWGNEL